MRLPIPGFCLQFDQDALGLSQPAFIHGHVNARLCAVGVNLVVGYFGGIAAGAEERVRVR